MEEIITLDGKQFKLATDRPLTATERAQVLTEIRKQTGCSTCNQPRTMSGGFNDIQSLAGTCAGSPKSEGQTVTLTANPLGGVGPYNVRFWKKHSAAGYTEVDTVRQISEGSYTTASFTIFDTDYTLAIGDATAKVPISSTAGAILNGTTVSGLATGSIRVATTTYDSCPTTPSTCAEWCDVVLTCVAPTCNFVVT